MLRKITVQLNIMTALSIFWIVIADNAWLSENFYGKWGWVFILALITNLVTGVYLKITRFEREAYHETKRP